MGKAHYPIFSHFYFFDGNMMNVVHYTPNHFHCAKLIKLTAKLKLAFNGCINEPELELEETQNVNPANE